MRQNQEVITEIKSRRLLQSEPIDESSWAYMKLLRTQSKTRRVYEVNPYAEVYQFRDNLYGIFTHNADGMGDPWIYLLKGPGKAMLIDTGFGIGDLKGLVRELVGDMPLIVVNTHAHPDHAMGNCQFERVYIHEFGVPALKAKMVPEVWDYLFDEDGKGKWMEFDKADIIPFRQYEIVGCEDGYEFDLGERYVVKLIHVPGHAAEHSFFLDKQSRILFAGDEIISMRVGIMARPGVPYGEYGCVEEFARGLERVLEHRDEFDSVFPGHFICDLEGSVVENMYKACQEVLENPESCSYKAKSHRGEERCYKYVEGLGTLCYDPEYVYRRGEKQE